MNPQRPPPPAAVDLSELYHDKMARPLAILLSLFMLLLTALSTSVGSLEVRTTSGTFRGFARSGLDRWLGVPFAQPPIGSLRFKAPRPITKASRIVKNATAFGDACPQVPSNSLGAPLSEDCLFLNVSFVTLCSRSVHKLKSRYGIGISAQQHQQQ